MDIRRPAGAGAFGVDEAGVCDGAGEISAISREFSHLAGIAGAAGADACAGVANFASARFGSGGAVFSDVAGHVVCGRGAGQAHLFDARAGRGAGADLLVQRRRHSRLPAFADAGARVPARAADRDAEQRPAHAPGIRLPAGARIGGDGIRGRNGQGAGQPDGKPPRAGGVQRHDFRRHRRAIWIHRVGGDSDRLSGPVRGGNRDQRRDARAVWEAGGAGRGGAAGGAGGAESHGGDALVSRHRRDAAVYLVGGQQPGGEFHRGGIAAEHRTEPAAGDCAGGV